MLCMSKNYFLLAFGLLALLSCGPRKTATSSTSQTDSSLSSKTPIDTMVADGVYDLYCLNDFHGSINFNDESYTEYGLGSIFSELKRRKDADPEHTFIFSAGDMFQGSLESNSNYGHLVLDAMNVAGFDAMAIGNHEFDYGQERLFELEEAADFPFLGANMYLFEDGETKERIFDSRVQPSTIIERGGNRIGIIGTIGSGLTNSITSSCVENVVFVDPEDIIIEEAKRLKNIEKCSMVILLCHQDSRYLKWYDGLSDYVDAAFCGHTHSRNLDLIDGKLPAVQSYCNGQRISYIQLTVKNGLVSCSEYEIIEGDTWETDPAIQEVIDEYLDADFQAMANEVLGTLDGEMSKGEVANLGCKAIYEKYVAQYPDLTFAIENSQRDELYPGELTYSALYKATPFMNKICILNVLGSEIKYVSSSNHAYSGAMLEADDLQLNEYYKVAVIDYVGLHQNTRKQYDNFNSLNGDGEIIATYETYPVDLTADYIKNDLHGVVNVRDYYSSAPGFVS